MPGGGQCGDTPPAARRGRAALLRARERPPQTAPTLPPVAGVCPRIGACALEDGAQKEDSIREAAEDGRQDDHPRRPRQRSVRWLHAEGAGKTHVPLDPQDYLLDAGRGPALGTHSCNVPSGGAPSLSLRPPPAICQLGSCAREHARRSPRLVPRGSRHGTMVRFVQPISAGNSRSALSEKFERSRSSLKRPAGGMFQSRIITCRHPKLFSDLDHV